MQTNFSLGFKTSSFFSKTLVMNLIETFQIRLQAKASLRNLYLLEALDGGLNTNFHGTRGIFVILGKISQFLTQFEWKFCMFLELVETISPN